jgi:protein-disulfide isomerase
MFRTMLDRISTPILVFCFIAVTPILHPQQPFPPPPPLPSRPTQAAKSRVLPDAAASDGGELQLGPKNATLKIVEFADFECPYCAVAAGELHEIRTKYPNVLSVTFRHFPLHENSRAAALASECAAAQGAFEPYYYALYENYASLGKGKWRQLAKQAGVPNLNDFDQCVKTERFASRIDSDTAAAARAGVGATPTWVVGDSVFGGTPSLAQIESWIQRARDQKGATSVSSRK